MSARMAASLSVPLESLPHRSIGAGEIIFLEGQVAKCAYVILKGEAQVVLSGFGGTQVTINRMKTGEMFGEIALLQADGKRTATVISEGGCELVELDGRFFDQSLKKADPLLRYVVSHLCRRLVELSARAAEAGIP